MKKEFRLAITGFMGVGKSSVARHLANAVRCKRVDLDHVIELIQKKPVAQLIDTFGIEKYRSMETDALRSVLDTDNAQILSLGGGTWTLERNRQLLKEHGYTCLWLEADFDHCWLNITYSRKERPLARDKEAARKLFDERQNSYCLADWHFVIRPEHTSHSVARQIKEELFS